MIPNLPTLPPALLEDCLAFSKQLYALKSGVAKLEVSPSHFVFSMNQFPGNKNHFPGNKESGSIRKKSPSDLRRNALRKAEHLKRKNGSRTTTSFSSHQVSTEDPHPTSSPGELSPGFSSEPTEESPSPNPSSTPSVDNVDLSKVPVINSDIMDTMEPDVPVINESPVIKEASNAMDIVEETVPVINVTRNNSNSDDALKPKIALDQEQTDLPPAISPISTPVKINKQEEIHLLFCAQNLAAASKLAKDLPNIKYIGPHPKNTKHHFLFSTLLPSANLQALKEAIDTLDEPFLLFHVVSEKKNFFLKKRPNDHCQACQKHHRKK